MSNAPSLWPQGVLTGAVPHPAACAPQRSAKTGARSRGGHWVSPGSSAWKHCGRLPSAPRSLSGGSCSPAGPKAGAVHPQPARSVRRTANTARLPPSRSTLRSRDGGDRNTRESVSQ